MTKDYGEIICSAVDEIVRARLGSLEFNVTKTCTIIDISARKQGKYGVSDGSVSFVALSQDTTYNLDDSVLVLIPNGDYKNDKLILSKINKDTELPYNYTSPMSTMVVLTDNVLGSAKYGSAPLVETGGLLANEPAADEHTIGTSVVLYEFQDNLDQLNGFTRIGLSVNFKSLLSGLNVRSGAYGIFLEVYSKQGEQGQEKSCVTVLPFDCYEMAGNPYEFDSFFTQEKVFDISHIQNIQKICVVFYQSADFKNAEGNLIPHQHDEFNPSLGESVKKNNVNNLFATNVKLYFGQGANEFDKETLTVFTNDLPSYHYTRNNDKVLNLRWVHKIDDNTYKPLIGGSSLDTTKYEVRWYRYNSQTTVVDEYAGEGWELLPADKTDFSIRFNPDLKRTKEKIKVIGVVRDGTVVFYESNIMEFTNEEYVPDAAIFDVSDGLSIGFSDNTAGNYFLYDQNGYLNNKSLGSTYIRSLVPLWKGVQINYDTFPGEKIDYVQWWFPADHTMIVCAENTTDIEILNGVEYKVFSYYPNSLEGSDWDKNDLVFDYSIKEYWAKNESNNTVRCVFSKNGVEYTAIEELQFGRAGSNGTNLTMVLEFMNGGNALVLDIDHLEEYDALLVSLQDKMTIIHKDYVNDMEHYELEIKKIKEEYGKSLLPYSNSQKYQSGMQAMYDSITTIQNDYLDGKFESEIAYEIALAEAECKAYQDLIQSSTDEQYRLHQEMAELEMQKLQAQYKYGEISEQELQKQIAELKAECYKEIIQYPTQLKYQEAIETLSKEMLQIEEAYQSAIIASQEAYEVLLATMQGECAKALKQTSCYGLGVEARLYDSNGSRIDFTEDQVQNITWSWFKPNEEALQNFKYMKFEVNQILNDDGDAAHNDSSVTISWDEIPSELPTDNYFILQATYKADILATELVAYLPIPIKLIGCSHIEGAKEVIYNHQGTPSYYKDAYKAFEYVKKDDKWTYNELTKAKWLCETYGVDDQSLLPHLKTASETDSRVALVAPQFYVKGQNDMVCVSCEYWSQPILVMQSQYDFAMLNSWDENLTIDEKNGTILSTMLGAGKKVNNVFSGVLIGDLVAGTDLLTAPRNTGVYGFSEGQLSFGFKDDGTAFIGKQGKGQIIFDGNKGQITSPSVTFDREGNPTAITPGINIDLDDAHILISGESDRDTERNLFDVCLDNKSLIHVSDDEYYMQSADYKVDGSGKGFKIDLKSGSIKANDFTLQDYDNCNLLYLNGSTYYLQSHGFSDVNKTGTQINLNTGSIKSYDFDLQSITNVGQYAGSSLCLSSGDNENNIGPFLTVTMVKDSNTLKLLDVSTNRFVMHSPTWYEGTSVITVNTPTKYYCKSGWNIRKSPNGTKIGFVSAGFYTEVFASNGDWRQIKQSTSADSNEWWVWYEAIDYTKKQEGYSGTQEIACGKGLMIDMGEGNIIGYSSTNDVNALQINTKNNTYALSIGPVASPNLQLAWDGSLKGGSSFKWSIAQNGEATFDRLIANGGELKDLDIQHVDISNANMSYAYIYSGTIGSCKINKSGISSDKGGWAFNSDGTATLPSTLYFGEYELSVKEQVIQDTYYYAPSLNYVTGVEFVNWVCPVYDNLTALNYAGVTIVPGIKTVYRKSFTKRVNETTIKFMGADLIPVPDTNTNKDPNNQVSSGTEA